MDVHFFFDLILHFMIIETREDVTLLKCYQQIELQLNPHHLNKMETSR